MQTSDLCHIVGAGAIGQFFAYSISNTGTNVCLHAREAVIESIEIEDTHQKTHQQNLENDDNLTINTLIICTKAFNAVEAFKQFESRLNKQSTVICLFNGLGPQFDIQAAHPNTWFASTTHGVRKKSKTSIIHTGLGITTIGSLTDSKPSALFSKFNFDLSANILEILYLKLAINSLINPLTATYNCKNGDLLENQNALSTMKKLAKEIEAICIIKEINLTADEIFKKSCSVAKNTAINYSSMQQDIINKRQSEITLINGYWAQLGKSLSIPTPENTTLTQKIQSIN